MKTIGLEFVGQGEVGFYEVGDPPDPGPTQVLIETVYSGVTNGTERHRLLTEHGFGQGRYPARVGYQVVGPIVAVGSAVTRFREGDWVFCGEHEGHRGWKMVEEDGLLVDLPDTVDRKHCALFGTACVALRAVRRMGVAAGDNVWVVGQGPIGNFVGQAARAMGAQVTVSDLVPRRLEVAQRCGAHLVLNAGHSDVWDRLEAEGPFDFIYDCCSVEDLFFDIREHRLLAYGGTIGAMAVRDTVTFPWGMLHGRVEGKIEVACHFLRDDLRVLRFLYEQGAVRTEPLVSHKARIEEAEKIYGLLAGKAEELLGVIFEW